jgi:hypothetical protein
VVVFCESRSFFRLPLKILGVLRRSIRSIVHFWRHLGELDLEKSEVDTREKDVNHE